jgi:hypothetical protein
MSKPGCPMKINIQTINHEEQRYPTVGDWWVDSDGTWQVRVSKMSDWRYEVLVAIHELVEMAWCQWHGVSEQAVTDFDIEFEHEREPRNVDEPGDDPAAPYHHGHQWATGVERFVSLMLGVDWKAYEAAVESL